MRHACIGLCMNLFSSSQNSSALMEYPYKVPTYREAVNCGLESTKSGHSFFYHFLFRSPILDFFHVHNYMLLTLVIANIPYLYCVDFKMEVRIEKQYTRG